MKKTGITELLCVLGMGILILDSKTALSGAQAGISLCIRTVIPSLFPFFVLSIALTGSLLGSDLPIFRPLGRLMGVPMGAEPILLAGFLGGYPVGAQTIGTAHRAMQLSDSQARRMLAFCNNCGPSFLFGMTAALFSQRWVPWALWAIHLISAVAVSALLPRKSSRQISVTARSVTLPGALRSAVGVMGSVCGWVILFRVLLAFWERWIGWLLPDTFSVILSGILELANGCCALAGIENSGLRFILCAGMLSFGGLCVGLQTLSVAQNADTSLYFPGKLLQTVFSILLALPVQTLLPDGLSLPYPWIMACICILACMRIIKFRKRSSIPGKAVV